MKDLLERYQQLNKEQRIKIFSEEQIKCLDSLIFFNKLFSDKKFYKSVESAIGEEAYKELKYECGC